jgi:hypothetical protein
MLALLVAQSLEDTNDSIGQFKDAIDSIIALGHNIVFTTGFILTVLFVLIGFFRYIFNDPKGGATQVQNSLIGLALLGVSQFIIDLVNSLSQGVANNASGQNLGTAIGQTVYGTIIPLLGQWAGAFAVLAIVWGGLQWMTGSPDTGKKWVTNTLIGVAGMVFAWVIVATFGQALGIVNVVNGN